MKNLKIARNAQGLTQAKLAKKLNVSRSTVAMWEAGETQPSGETLAALSKILKVTTDFLLNCETNSSPTPANIYSIESRVMRPIVGSVRAGWNGNAEAEYDGELPAYDLKNPEQYVWLRIKGDSMEDEMHDGDFALVHLQNTAENGDYAVVIVNGDEGTVKRFHSQDGDILLEPINRKYSSMFFSRERAKEVYIYGVVREIKRKY